MAIDISIVILGVEDLDRAIEFCESLGLLQARDPDHAIPFLTQDSARLGHYPRGLLAEDATVPVDGEGFTGITLAHNVGPEAAVEGLIDEAAAAGAEVVKPAQAAD